MAPVPRQSHYVLIPRPPKLARADPAAIAKVLVQLFAGTVCIFILAILFWRIGRFFRYFTKGKVLRKGNATTTRYAKTWYGWVTLQQHEANKNIFRRCFAKMRELTPWRSSHKDYSWVWWNPGDEDWKTYHEKRRILNSVPNWIRSYDIKTAEVIPNPIPAYGSSPENVANDRMETGPCITMTGALSARCIPKPMTRPRRRNMSTSTESCFGTRFCVAPRSRERFMSLNDCLGPECIFSSFLDSNRPPLHSFSLPCLLLSWGCSEEPRMNSQTKRKPKSTGSSDANGVFLPALQHSRRYQIWSARMGLQTRRCIGYNTHTLPGAPPGSPKSALLGSFLSTNTALGLTSPGLKIRNVKYSSKFSTSSLASSRCHNSITRNGRLGEQAKSIDTERNRKENSGCSTRSSPCASKVLEPRKHEAHARNSVSNANEKNLTHTQTLCTRKNAGKKEERRITKMPLYIVPPKDLSNWEVRLIDNLDRKLEWNINQLSPGRRPFHFTLLKNHWLNRETWIVYDPASRVPIDARRRLGDPRFNVPYPAPNFALKPKYPRSIKQVAHTPKIASWRAAVNRYRRSCGLNAFLKGIELYDGSAEDPPDGKVDPASWILRRPPQGFSFSARQQNTYYEGGAGWQEKLGDWQKVRPGYRMRKAVFEGRVNRTRVKEVTLGINYYRMGVIKASKTFFYPATRDDS